MKCVVITKIKARILPKIFCYFGKYMLYCLLFISVSCTSPENPHYKSDPDFILLNEEISPNKDFKYYEYQFNTGAYGYSRVFWSIVNTDENNSDLSKSLIPDGYKIIGWSMDSELLLEEWEPYYYKSEEIKLLDGMELSGVKIKLSDSDHERYEAALQYIISDEDFTQMLKDFNRYEVSSVYKDEELIYKVYPDVLNELFRAFTSDINELVENGKAVEFDFDRMDTEIITDSTLVQYSKSDTANIQIFFSQMESNLLATQVFTNSSDIPKQYDGYRAIAMSNIGMEYLFIFKENEIIDVRKQVVQYN